MTARQLAPGSVVSGKYKVLERLGGGGMGDVYRAEHVLAGRVVAFKLLRADFAGDEDLTRRFFQEAQAVNRIRHPNIVDVLDAGFSEEGPYVVMECLEGTSVSAALARIGRLDVTTSIAIVLPILDALDAAHRAGIVHRDLKPENVFITRLPDVRDEARVKILDFGIAKVLDSDEAARPRTHTGIIFGTPDYLSPEQASGEGIVDGRSDLFAVGIVLFELVTGRRPFEAKNAMATAYRIVHEPTPRLEAFGVDVDPRMQAALDVALAKAAVDRFATAAAFAEALAPLAGERPSRDVLASLLAAVGHDRARTSSSVTTRAADPSPHAPTELAMPRPVSSGRISAATMVSPSTPSAPSVVKPSTPSGPSLTRSGTSSPPPRSSTAPPRASTSPPPPSVTRRTPAWAARPLPSHVRGRCHARGTFARAVFRWLERARGREAVDAVLALLPESDAHDFRADAFNALVWYELEPIDMLMELATPMLLDGATATWRSLAYDNFAHDLGPILRRSSRLLDPVPLFERAAAAWGKILDFGKIRVVPAGPGQLSMIVEGFEAASLAMRYAFVGTNEGLLASAATDATVRIAAGESSFARELELSVAWRA